MAMTKDGFPADVSEWVCDPADDHGYSYDKTYTRSTDDKGHSTTVRVNAPPYVVAELKAIVAKHDTWRTVEDVFRDGAFHRLRWHADGGQDPRAAELAKRMSGLEAVERLNRQREECSRFLEEVKTALSAAREEGDVAGITAVLYQVDEVTPTMNAYWRDKVNDRVKDYRLFLAQHEDV